MKRIFLSVLLCVGIMGSVFAGFTFDFGPNNPLYPAMKADIYSYGSDLKYIQQFSSSPQGNNIMVIEKGKSGVEKYRYATYRDWSSKSNSFLQLKLGAGISLLRLGWPGYFVADATVQAGLNSIFVMQGGTALVGFDGTYFIGGEAKIMDMFVAKAGLRHFSGHTGDEIITAAMDKVTYDFSVVEYVRDNMLEVGIGYVGIPYAQAFFSVLIPLKTSWWAPYFHQPDWVVTTTGAVTSDRNQDEWAVRQAYGNGYGAYVLQLDVNAAYPFLDKYEAYGSFNMKFHQDGMTNHTLTPTDDTSQWELEYTAMLGFSVTNPSIKKTIALEVAFHDGRFPLLNFFWKRSQYLSVGISIR